MTLGHLSGLRPEFPRAKGVFGSFYDFRFNGQNAQKGHFGHFRPFAYKTLPPVLKTGGKVLKAMGVKMSKWTFWPF